MPDLRKEIIDGSWGQTNAEVTSASGSRAMWLALYLRSVFTRMLRDMRALSNLRHNYLVARILHASGTRRPDLSFNKTRPIRVVVQSRGRVVIDKPWFTHSAAALEGDTHRRRINARCITYPRVVHRVYTNTLIYVSSIYRETDASPDK